MNLKLLAILILMFLLVTLSVVCQLDWIINSYHDNIRHQETECKKILDFCLQNAIDEELPMRTTLPEVDFTSIYVPFARDDSSNYVVKTVETVDTMFQVRIHKHNTRAYFMIRQYIMKSFKPVHLGNLDQALKSCLKSNIMQPDTCYIEYFGLAKSIVLDHTATEKPDRAIASEVIPLDILETTGIKAYISKDNPTLWEIKKCEIIETIAYEIVMMIILLCIYIFRKQFKLIIK